MFARPRVVLLIESSRAYGRGVLHGIAEYVRLHGPWEVYLPERGLGDDPPPWLRGWKGDGLIARVENQKIARVIQNLQLPTVDLRGMARIELGLPLINTDNEMVAKLAFGHFQERGFRHFAFCGFPGADYSDRRCQFFVRYVEESGAECHVFRPSQMPQTELTALLEQSDSTRQIEVGEWLKSLPKPLALMTANDVCGQQALSACRTVDLAVPEQVAVLGVDNDEVLCDLSDPPLSSIVPDKRRIGYEAAALLERMMGGERPSQMKTHIPPKGLVIRQSTDTLAIEDQDLAYAVRYIREHACDDITLPDLLAKIPISRNQFYRRFSELLGHSPKTEILRVRLDRVKRLLSETNLPLKQIATRAGFKYPEYLNAVFKERTGYTPGEYRKLHPNPNESFDVAEED